MNTRTLLFLLAIAGLSSCTTAYKIGQTPDDVYYSPTPAQNEYVTITNEEDRNVYNNNSTADDREIRRRVNNRRLRIYDDYDYGYNYYGNNYYPYSYPYAYSYPYGYNYYNYYSPYSYYTYPVYIYPKGGQSSSYIAPRKYNLAGYNPTPRISNTAIIPSAKSGIQGTSVRNNAPARSFTKPPASNGSGVGNFIRKVFTPTSGSGNNRISNNSSNNNTQSRTFEPSRSSSSSPSSSRSSSSGGGNAPVRSFHR